jgi:hypothetical protein
MNFFSKVLITALMLSFALNNYANTRKDLKRLCKEQQQICKKENKNKTCRKIKKECRIQNKVTLKDDIKHVKEQILNLGNQVARNVEMELSHDNTGEYILIRFITKRLGRINDMTYIPHGMHSHIAIINHIENQHVEFKIYTHDLESNQVGEYLQTSPGRIFPKFINGKRYQQLFGQQFSFAGVDNYQIYFDPKNKVFGMFIPQDLSGSFIDWLNNLKEQLGQIGTILPNINSIPVNIKLNKQKVGRVSMLAYDQNQLNAGIVILLDHSEVKQELNKE